MATGSSAHLQTALICLALGEAVSSAYNSLSLDISHRCTNIIDTTTNLVSSQHTFYGPLSKVLHSTTITSHDLRRVERRLILAVNSR